MDPGAGDHQLTHLLDEGIEPIDRPMVPIAADAGLNQGRWLLDRLLKAENGGTAP